MKAVNTILKILAALAAIAGVVYVVAAYGDRIVAWAKKLLASCPCHAADPDAVEDSQFECACHEQAPVEEAAEVPAEEAAEVPAEQADEAAPVAEDADFEG